MTTLQVALANVRDVLSQISGADTMQGQAVFACPPPINVPSPQHRVRHSLSTIAV